MGNSEKKEGRNRQNNSITIQKGKLNRLEKIANEFNERFVIISEH